MDDDDHVSFLIIPVGAGLHHLQLAVNTGGQGVSASSSECYEGRL